MTCINYILPEPAPFTGCDGKPISDGLLRRWLEMAIEEEDYKFAGNCKKEMDRRLLINAT